MSTVKSVRHYVTYYRAFDVSRCENHVSMFNLYSELACLSII